MKGQKKSSRHGSGSGTVLYSPGAPQAASPGFDQRTTACHLQTATGTTQQQQRWLRVKQGGNRQVRISTTSRFLVPNTSPSAPPAPGRGQESLWWHACFHASQETQQPWERNYSRCRLRASRVKALHLERLSWSQLPWQSQNSPTRLSTASPAALKPAWVTCRCASAAFGAKSKAHARRHCRSC